MNSKIQNDLKKEITKKVIGERHSHKFINIFAGIEECENNNHKSDCDINGNVELPNINPT